MFRDVSGKRAAVAASATLYAYELRVNIVHVFDFKSILFFPGI